MNKARRARMEVMADVFEDLPDGAFFAAMAEQGFDADDLRHLNPNQPERQRHRCQVCPRRFASNAALQQHRRDKHPPLDLAPSPSAEADRGR